MDNDERMARLIDRVKFIETQIDDHIATAAKLKSDWAQGFHTGMTMCRELFTLVKELIPLSAYLKYSMDQQGQSEEEINRLTDRESPEY